MAQCHTRLSESIVEIRVEVLGRSVYFDGIVVAIKPTSTCIIAHSIVVGKNRVTHVIFPSGADLAVTKSYASNNGIAVLICNHQNKEDQCGLKEIDFFDGVLQANTEVFTYSHRKEDRVLTRGTIMSVDINGFNHTCPAHRISKFGSAVINVDAQLVCYSCQENVSSWNAVSIATKINQNLGRPYLSVQVTLQNLRTPLIAV